MTFTASAGFVTSVLGFDLGGWPMTDYTINSVQVLAATNPFSQSNVLVRGAGPSHTAFSFPTPPTGPTVTVLIDASNLNSNTSQFEDIGLDNLRFSEAALTAVPEPASILLVGSELIGLAARVRRRRR